MNDNAGHCSHVAMGVKTIPDVPGVVALVGRAGVAGLLLALHFVAEAVDFEIGRAHV